MRHGTDAGPIDWIGLARAVERVAALVRHASERRILHLYIGGQGPLPVFAHLGQVLSKFVGTQWLITVELAPVRARLDHRFDRQVLSALPSTELFAAIDGRLIRRGKQPGFDPGSLVDAVRAYNSDAIRSAMRYLVGEARSLLVPWRP